MIRRAAAGSTTCDPPPVSCPRSTRSGTRRHWMSRERSRFRSPTGRGPDTGFAARTSSASCLTDSFTSRTASSYVLPPAGSRSRRRDVTDSPSAPRLPPATLSYRLVPPRSAGWPAPEAAVDTRRTRVRRSSRSRSASGRVAPPARRSRSPLRESVATRMSGAGRRDETGRDPDRRALRRSAGSRQLSQSSLVNRSPSGHKKSPALGRSRSAISNHSARSAMSGASRSTLRYTRPVFWSLSLPWATACSISMVSVRTCRRWSASASPGRSPE
jgi:hypothetical protein